MVVIALRTTSSSWSIWAARDGLPPAIERQELRSAVSQLLNVARSLTRSLSTRLSSVLRVRVAWRPWSHNLKGPPQLTW